MHKRILMYSIQADAQTFLVVHCCKYEMSQIIDKSLNRFKNCVWCHWTKKKSIWKIFLKFLKTWGKKGCNQNSDIPASLCLCAPVTVSARQGRLNCEAQLITKGMWGSVPTDTCQEFLSRRASQAQLQWRPASVLPGERDARVAKAGILVAFC